MRDPNRSIVIMQWVVIAVLLVGGGIGAYILISQNNQLQDEQATQEGNLTSLANQLRAAKASPTPVTTPLPEASSNLASPTPTPKATATPKSNVSNP